MDWVRKSKNVIETREPPTGSSGISDEELRKKIWEIIQDTFVTDIIGAGYIRTQGGLSIISPETAQNLGISVLEQYKQKYQSGMNIPIEDAVTGVKQAKVKAEVYNAKVEDLEAKAKKSGKKVLKIVNVDRKVENAVINAGAVIARQIAKEYISEDPSLYNNLIERTITLPDGEQKTVKDTIGYVFGEHGIRDSQILVTSLNIANALGQLKTLESEILQNVTRLYQQKKAAEVKA